MEDLFLTLFNYLYFGLVGGLLGLVALLPHVRAEARQKPRWRRGLMIFLGLLAFGVSVFFWNLAATDLLGGLARGLIAGGACVGTVWLLTKGFATRY
jgi:hypothetical protein